jgi:hypothetical protein
MKTEVMTFKGKDPIRSKIVIIIIIISDSSKTALLEPQPSLEDSARIVIR